MAYSKKTWKGRTGTGLNKYVIGQDDGYGKQTITSAPDEITQEGDALSASNLNDLENRIDTEFTNVNNEIDKLKDGTTPAAKATKAYSDEDGNNIKATYGLKDTDAGSGNVAKFDANGNPIDAGFKALDTLKAHKITALNTTLADIASVLNTVNGVGDHIFFDVSALGASAYLCTIYMDGYPDATTSTICKCVDLVKGRVYQTAYDGTMLLTSFLAMMDDFATELEVQNLSSRIDKLVGGDVGDDVIRNYVTGLTVSSSSGNLSFTVTDEWAFSFVVGEVEPNKEYLLVYDGTGWTYNGESVTVNGITITGTPSTGEVMKVVMTVSQRVDTVVHHHKSTDTFGTNETRPQDANIDDFYILEQKYVYDSGFNFDAPESAICVTEGYTLPAGKYYVYNVAGATSDYWCNYKRLYYCFEIANDIIATAETGDIQLRFYNRSARETTGDARGVYQLDCKPYKCVDNALYNSDVISFVGQIAQPSEEYTDIRTLTDFTTDQTMTSEGIIYNNLGHVCYGNNEIGVANIKQLINSEQKSITPVRLHKNDVVGGLSGKKGSLYGLDPRVYNKIIPATVYQEHGLNDEFTRYEIYSDNCKMFLLSMKEMSFNTQTDEGIVTNLYSAWCNNTLTNNAVASRGKANKAGLAPSDYRWSRSAYAGFSSYSRGVSATGAYVNNSADSGYRFAQAYILKSLID